MRQLTLLLVATVAFAACEGVGLTINIDFQPTINDTSVAVNTYTADYSGTAAAPDSGTVWNSLLSNNPAPAVFIGQPGYYDEVGGAVSNYSDLLDSNGNPTPVDISFDAAGAFAVEDNAPNMPNIATDAQGLMRDYLIAFRDGGLAGPRTVTPLTLGSDYVVLKDVFADANGEIVIKYSANGTPEGPFNGLQLMTVPEPSALVLMGLAGLGIFANRRQR